MAQVQDCNFHF